jgi:hypothetical protein
MTKHAAVTTVLELTHANRADLKAALKSGQTLAQFAAAHGSSAQAVTDALLPKLDQTVNQAVTDGTLSAAQAATLKDALPQRIQTILNRTRVHA